MKAYVPLFATAKLSVFKLKLLAFMWALTKCFAIYLKRAKFEVWTDNNPLLHLQTVKLGTLKQHWTAHFVKI